MSSTNNAEWIFLNCTRTIILWHWKWLWSLHSEQCGKKILYPLWRRTPDWQNEKTVKQKTVPRKIQIEGRNTWNRVVSIFRTEISRNEVSNFSLFQTDRKGFLQNNCSYLCLCLSHQSSKRDQIWVDLSQWWELETSSNAWSRLLYKRKDESGSGLIPRRLFRSAIDIADCCLLLNRQWMSEKNAIRGWALPLAYHTTIACRDRTLILSHSVLGTMFIIVPWSNSIIIPLKMQNKVYY